MNSTERKELRYQRRKHKREEKKILMSNKYADINKAFNFHKVMYYADKCTNGVGYKKSTILFKLHLFTNISKCCYDIKNDCYKVGKTYRFKLNERGKIRDIDAPYITDRLVHKVLSNEILIPLYNYHLIYDNGASIKNKGFLFNLKRVKYKLHKWYLKHGLNGYIVLIDYSKFFLNVDHDIIRSIHNKYIFNNKTKKIIEDYLFISKGIGLGIEIAQREASIIPNILDNYICQKGYSLNRYMDDSFFIVKEKNEGINILNNYIILANKLNIKINKNKSKIIPIEKKFRYCNWIYMIDKFGKIKIIPYKNTIYRERRKLRKMINNNITKEEINIVRNSFISYLDIGNSYKYIKYLKKII